MAGISTLSVELTVHLPDNHRRIARDRFNAVLDGFHYSGTSDHVDADTNCLMNDEHVLMNNAQIKKQAEHQEESRRRFDRVLSRPTSEWHRVSDPGVQSKAFITFLQHIRGHNVPSAQGPDMLTSTSALTANSKSPGLRPNVDPQPASFVYAFLNKLDMSLLAKKCRSSQYCSFSACQRLMPAAPATQPQL